MIAQTALHEIAAGVSKPFQISDLRMQSVLRPVLELFLGARSVFDAVTASVVKVPADKHKSFHVFEPRDFSIPAS